ncbi:MAG: rhomboid family intramembrane serine protease [Pirellulales bacterium]
MGIYDRDYERQNYDQPSGFRIGAPQSVTMRIIVITAIVYVAQLLSHNWVTSVGQLYAGWFHQPWQVYRLLTYGFLHSPDDLWHIVLNMFALWMFGREVEYRYSSREFGIFYLVAIVFAGITWTLSELSTQTPGGMLGASGGVAAVIVLFALNFPHRTILFNFFIPMPMWLLAVIMIAGDAFGAISRSGAVAFTAHLGGALFAFLYYKFGWQLSNLVPDASFAKRLRPKPRLRVVDPDEPDDSIEDQVDAILKKIQDHGRDSLTRGERRILEEASREYQKRRK